MVSGVENSGQTQDLALSEPLRESLRFGFVLSCARLHIGLRERGARGACVAQLAEHVLGKDEVSGSIPLAGSRSKKFE